jgi:DNA-binding NarL/FixJ family response regulator
MLNTFELDRQGPTGSRKTLALTREKSAMTSPRVLLADDQEQMLRTLAELLAGEFRVIGTANNGIRAVERALCLAPDIVVLDISMPLVNGIEAARRLRDHCPSARVVIVTVDADKDLVEGAMSAGAFGYVLKSRLSTDLAPAIWKAFRGETFVSPME